MVIEIIEEFRFVNFAPQQIKSADFLRRAGGGQ
jgi:hypothetical protein